MRKLGRANDRIEYKNRRAQTGKWLPCHCLKADMSLSCACDWRSGDWTYFDPDDYSTTPKQGHRKRCCSCQEQIPLAAISTEFLRVRSTQIGMEFFGFGPSAGADKPLPSWWMCERCSDLYFSLLDLGFCITLGEDDMRELVKEYAQERR